MGRKLSDLERRVGSQPVRYGGLGILDPTKTADHAYHTSVNVTKSLVELISRQDQDLSHYDEKKVKEVIDKMKDEKENLLKDEHMQILNEVDVGLKRYVQLAAEKGAGSWLTALPLQSCGYDLNKLEFRDGICLRYGWKIPHTPTHCSCQKKNTIDHMLNCKLGGFVHWRHDNVRNLEARLHGCYGPNIDRN